MKFEGTQVNIPIKGIMRASTDNLCADGAMNEVIGMEYKDGSWLPYKEKATLDNHGFIPGVASTEASRIYVHKLSDNTTEDLFVYDVFYGEYHEGDEKVPVLYYYGYPDESSSDSSDSGEPEKVRIEIAPYVRDVSFIGNILCVATDNGIRYFLWKDGKYTEQVNSSLPKVELRVTAGLYDKSNENRVGMRYTSRASARSDSDSHTMAEDARRVSVTGNMDAAMNAVTEEGGLTGYVLACYAFRLKNGSIAYASAPVLLGRPMKDNGDATVGFKENNLNTNASGQFSTSYIEEGSSSRTRYFLKGGPSPLAEGTDNDYAIFELPPPPEMLWDEDGTRIKEGQFYVEQHTSEDNGTYCTTIDGVEEVPYPSGETPDNTLSYNMLLGISRRQNEDEIYGYTDYENFEKIKYKGTGTYVLNAKVPHGGTTPTFYPYTILAKNRPRIPNLACSMIHASLRRYTGSLQGEYFHKYIFSAYAAANKLQFKISNVQNIDNSDIESICIFMSREIRPYDLEKDDFLNQVYNDTNASRIYDQSGANWDEAWSIHYQAYLQYFQAKYKSDADLAEEIKDIKSFYLVKEIPKLDIENSSGWLTVDLKGTLGESLLTRETLPSTAFDWKTTIPEHLDAYNYRMHAYDYTQVFFKGYDIDAFAHNGGDGQIAQTFFHRNALIHDYNKFNWEIKVTLKDNLGNATVVTYDDDKVDTLIKTLSPYISYPSIYADSMTINVYSWMRNGDVRTSAVYSKTISFKHNTSLGLSYYLDPELKPIVESLVSGEDAPVNVPSFEEEDTTRYYPNGMKIADAAFPSYFPSQFTYRIGGGQLIGMGRMTVPVSQDNKGINKLVVFCTDGIYTLDVTPDGSGAYSAISFADGEVCTNRNSICEIGGAIVFASAKGLMMITGDGVKEFLPALNGKIRFKPAEAEDPYTKSGNAIYKKMITTDSIVKLDEKISYEDFLTFLNKEGTFVAYIAEKNKLLVFNNGKNIYDHEHSYCYLIDIPTRNTTKLATRFFAVDNNNIGKRFWYAERASKSGRIQATYSNVFEYYSQEANLDCLIASRPIKIQQDDKNSYRLVVSGYFEGAANQWAELVVLGSLDADHWKVIGLKEKKLEGGFHNIGCVTDRDTWKYLMFIFAGQLSTESHIDYIDVTVEGRYNNKKR